MKLLLDTCVSASAANTLREASHDVDWVGDWEADPGDEAILAAALAEQRVLVTLDKDFGELAVVFGRPHRGILRIVNFRASQQAAAVNQVLNLHGAELEAGGLITVEPGKVRIRPAEGGDESDSVDPPDTGGS
ncbi:MAG: DUF5615 family PIN-like protein [Planctomycetaceae bacterium]